MTKVMKVFASMVILLVVAACQTNGWGQNQTWGTLGGAGLGGWAGSNIGGGNGRMAGTALGVLLGAWLGNEVGVSLDRADQMYAQDAAVEALEFNRDRVSSVWHNPNSGHSGMIEPTRTYIAPNGQQCREYTHTVTIGGRQERAYGSACRQQDGTWRITG